MLLVCSTAFAQNCPTLNTPNPSTASICDGGLLSLQAPLSPSVQSSTFVNWNFPDGTVKTGFSVSHVLSTNSNCVEGQSVTYNVICNLNGQVLISGLVNVAVYPPIQVQIASNPCGIEISTTCSGQVVQWHDGTNSATSTTYAANPGTSGFVQFTITQNGAPNSCSTTQFSAPYNCPAGPVTPRMRANIKLQGPLQYNGVMETALQSQSLLPISQPFSGDPYNYLGFEQVSVMPANIVDWVLVEARTDQEGGTVVERRAALLRNDGAILELDGQEGVMFSTLNIGEPYFLAIHHLSHLSVLSSEMIVFPNSSTFNFSESPNMTYGNAQMVESNGIWAMRAGDFDHNQNINVLDFLIWFSDNAAVSVYVNQDGDRNGLVNILDFLLWFDNRSFVGIPQIQL